MRRYWQLCGIPAGALCLVWALAALAPSPVAAQEGPPYPRLANFYLHGSVDPSEIPLLARWDVLILSTVWKQEQLQQLKSYNPNLKIFLYVCPYCVNSPPNPADTWQVENFNYALVNNLWWYNWNLTMASDWPGTTMVNITDVAPAGPQGTWRQYLTSRVDQLMRTRPGLDGIFYDNFWKSIGWEQGGVIQVDSDCNPVHNPAGCDGAMDSDAYADTLWSRALRDMARTTRTKFDLTELYRGTAGKLGIISNSSWDYYPWLNGTLYEYFPTTLSGGDPGNVYGYAWNPQMTGQPGGYMVAPFSSDPWRVSVINADWEGDWDHPTRSADFERHKRFTLASALMGDGYYSLDAAQTGHGSIWWEPEYDHGGLQKGYLGYPTGPMRCIGLPTGPEKVVNGSFGSGTSSWLTQQTNATGSFSIDYADYHTATGAARLAVSSVGSGGNYKLYQTIPVVKDRGYTLTLWARSNVAQSLDVSLYSPSCPGYRCLTDKLLPLTSTWTRYDIPFIATGSADAGLNIQVMKAGTVWIDDISLREGDTSVYRRDFDRGSVILNYTTTQRNVVLGGTYYRLNIPGSDVFNGAAVAVEAVPPSDARILLKTLQATPTPPPSPVAARLDQNTPNPFNPTTTIRFRVGQTEQVELSVFDVAGRLVKRLVNRRMDGGTEHAVTWNGTDRFGVRVPSGIYFYRITTPTFTERRKMTLLE